MDVAFGGKIIWDAVATASSYKVRARTTANLLINELDVVATEALVADLIAGGGLIVGQTFRVEVASVDSFGNVGTFSPQESFVLIVPPYPTNIRVG